MNRQAFVLLPALYSTEASFQIDGDFFPGIQPFINSPFGEAILWLVRLIQSANSVKSTEFSCWILPLS